MAEQRPRVTAATASGCSLEPARPVSARWALALAGSALCGLVLWLYRPILSLPLAADDWAVLNAARRWLGACFFGDWLGRGQLSSGLYRPVTVVSLRAGWELFGAWGPGHRGTNLVLHLLVGALFVLLGRVVIRLSWPWAAAAGFLFATKNALTEAVVLVAGRTGVLSALAMLVALLAAWQAERTRRARWAVTSIAGAAGALGAKEDAIVLPLLVFAMFVFLGSGGRGTRRWAITLTAGHVALAALYLGGRIAVFGNPLANPDYADVLASSAADPDVWRQWFMAFVRLRVVVLAGIAAFGLLVEPARRRPALAIIGLAGAGALLPAVIPSSWAGAAALFLALAALLAACRWKCDLPLRAGGYLVMLSAVAPIPALGLAVTGANRFAYVSAGATALLLGLLLQRAIHAARAPAGISRPLRLVLAAAVVLALGARAVQHMGALCGELQEWRAAILVSHRLATTIAADAERGPRVHDWAELDPRDRHRQVEKLAQFSRLLRGSARVVCIVRGVPGRIGRGWGPSWGFPLMVEASDVAGEPLGVLLDQEPAPGVPMEEAQFWETCPLEGHLTWYLAPPMFSM